MDIDEREPSQVITQSPIDEPILAVSPYQLEDYSQSTEYFSRSQTQPFGVTHQALSQTTNLKDGELSIVPFTASAYGFDLAKTEKYQG